MNDVPQRNSNTGRDTKQQLLRYRCEIEGKPRDILLRRYKYSIIRHNDESRCLDINARRAMQKKAENNDEIFIAILRKSAIVKLTSCTMI